VIGKIEIKTRPHDVELNAFSLRFHIYVLVVLVGPGFSGTSTLRFQFSVKVSNYVF
jgi:hypothetical protein